METVAGIQEDDLSSLAIEILDYSERISKIFDKIDLTIEKLPESYKSKASDEIYKKYQIFRENYPIIISNINSYSNDLSSLIIYLKTNIDYLSTMIVGYTNIREKETRKVS